MVAGTIVAESQVEFAQCCLGGSRIEVALKCFQGPGLEKSANRFYTRLGVARDVGQFLST